METEYMELINKQHKVISEQGTLIESLRQDLDARPIPIIPEFSIILYREKELDLDKTHQCSSQEAERIVMEFIETGKITLSSDWDNRKTVIAPYLVAKAIVENPIRKDQIRTVSAVDEKEGNA